MYHIAKGNLILSIYEIHIFQNKDIIFFVLQNALRHITTELKYFFPFFFKIESVPSERWIVNFDTDLLDGLVFATQLAAYCPFLVRVISMFSGRFLSEENYSLRVEVYFL